MRYYIKALSATNEIQTFEVDASDENAARAQAMLRSQLILSIRNIPNKRNLSRSRRSRFPTLLFSQELLGLLRAGLSLTESLEAIAEKEGRQEAKRIVETILQALRQGKAFSAALEKFPEYFPPVYIAAIRASEKTGDLPNALTRYISYRKQADFIKTQIISSSIYPATLLVIGGLVMLFLMFYVVPKFSRVYNDLHGDIPLLSRLLMQWGQFLTAHWPLIVTMILIGFAATLYFITSAHGRNKMLQQVMKIRAIQERIRIYQLSSFYRTLGMLLSGGIPLLQSLGMASGILTSDLRKQLHFAIAKISDGQSLSQALFEHGLTTSVSLRLLRVGERTGAMGASLDHISSLLDEELVRWIDWFTRLFEPLLMAVIGIIIGGVVILMYMPIFELASSIQ